MNITLEDGIITLPDGTQFPLPVTEQPAQPAPQPPQSERYCIVDGQYLLPFEEAFALMEILSRAQRVTTSYGETPFKPMSKADMLRCVMIPMSVYAQIQLERED